MKFDTDSLNDFLQDIPFYKNKECFCLGNTLEEAGCVISQIISDKENEIDVGLDYKGTPESN